MSAVRRGSRSVQGENRVKSAEEKLTLIAVSDLVFFPDEPRLAALVGKADLERNEAVVRFPSGGSRETRFAEFFATDACAFDLLRCR